MGHEAHDLRNGSGCPKYAHSRVAIVMIPEAGLEPAISAVGGMRLIHQATRAYARLETAVRPHKASI